MPDENKTGPGPESIAVKVQIDTDKLAAEIIDKLRDHLTPLPINAAAVWCAAGDRVINLFLNTDDRTTVAELSSPDDAAKMLGRVVRCVEVAYGAAAARAVAMHAFAVAFMGWPVLEPFPCPERPS